MILDIVQIFVLAFLSLANFALAYLIYKIQSDRNTPKLIVSNDVIEDDEHEANAIYVHNVGLVPAVGVNLLIDIEEWKGGTRLDSRFHEQHSAFSDRYVSLQPQEFRVYELPTMEDRCCVFTAVVECRNGPGDQIRFVLVGTPPDANAMHEVFSKSRRKKGIKALKKRKKHKDMRSLIGANSLKDYDDLFPE